MLAWVRRHPLQAIAAAGVLLLVPAAIFESSTLLRGSFTAITCAAVAGFMISRMR